MKGLNEEQAELIIKKEYAIAKQIVGDLEKRRRSFICDNAFIKYCCHIERSL